MAVDNGKLNIRHRLGELHPDLRLVSDRARIDRLYLEVWGSRYHGYTGPPPSPLANDVADFSVNDEFLARKGHCPVGLAVCTWNRPLYLESCLGSLECCDLSGAVTVLVDDASGDAGTLKLIGEFDIDSPLIKIYKTRRRQIHHSLDLAWCLLRSLGCRFLANLDADAVAAPSWLGALRSLHRRLATPDRTILSPFNKHPDSSVIEEAEDHLVKRELGGISYFFQAELLSTIRPFLFDIGWDGLVGGFFAGLYDEGYRLISTRPSYIQHIGAIGMNSGPYKLFDRAADFVGPESPSSRGRE